MVFRGEERGNGELEYRRLVIGKALKVANGAMVHGYPPEAGMIFISKRPILPLPSKYSPIQAPVPGLQTPDPSPQAQPRAPGPSRGRRKAHRHFSNPPPYQLVG